MMNNIRKVKSNTIEQLLQKRDEATYQKTKRCMQLAAKIQDGMKAKGMNNKQFAERLGKQDSVVSKWLSGTHNFTIDTLMDIENLLHIDLLALEPQQPPIVEKIYITEVNSRSNIMRGIRKQENIDVYDNIQMITAKPLSDSAFLTLPVYNFVQNEC